MKNIRTQVILLLMCLSVSAHSAVFAHVTCNTFTKAMSIGSKDTETSNDVVKLQHYLQTTGYLASEPTGYFGGMTKKALQAFQVANSISDTGTVGPLTRQKLQFLSCAQAAAHAMREDSSTSSMSTTSQVMISHQGMATTSVTSTKAQLGAYQGYVSGNIQVDASAVSKDYALSSCNKMTSENPSVSIRCSWKGEDIYTYSYVPLIVPTQAETPPGIVSLSISPTSVPYKGGYDSFELKTGGMRSCTLYFKDEPSSTWISGDSSLGVNYTLPGYKGMEKSRSYYSSCMDMNGRIVNSNTVLITVTR